MLRVDSFDIFCFDDLGHQFSLGNELIIGIGITLHVNDPPSDRDNFGLRSVRLRERKEVVILISRNAAGWALPAHH